MAYIYLWLNEQQLDEAFEPRTHPVKLLSTSTPMSRHEPVYLF